MSIDNMEQDLLAGYRELHDSLSEMIEGGRLVPAAGIPDDFRRLVGTLASLAGEGDALDRALAEENDEIYNDLKGKD